MSELWPSCESLGNVDTLLMTASSLYLGDLLDMTSSVVGVHEAICGHLCGHRFGSHLSSTLASKKSLRDGTMFF